MGGRRGRDVAEGVDVGEGALGGDVDVALCGEGGGGDEEDGLGEDPGDVRGGEGGVEFTHCC